MVGSVELVAGPLPVVVCWIFRVDINWNDPTLTPYAFRAEFRAPFFPMRRIAVLECVLRGGIEARLEYKWGSE
jgi:hypothetical protein